MRISRELIIGVVTFLIIVILGIFIFRIPAIGGCQDPNYLCCDGMWRIDYTCEPCDRCCLLKNAVSKNGTPVNCPTYCNCEDYRR